MNSIVALLKMMTTLFPFLQLCRLPTVFTAIADVFLGYLLVHSSLSAGDAASAWDFVLLLGATSGLYLAGMVFNDVFDRHVDATERPGRPIPSGRTSVRAAVVFGAGLMLLGLICAALVGRNTLIVAGLLTGCILGYDAGLKRTPLGPLTMGSCRFLNIIMAASSDWLRFEQLWWRPQIWVAAGMGIYITGITWFARTEAVRSSRGQLALATGMINFGLVVLLGWVAQWPTRQPAAVLIVLGVIVLTINRRLIAAIFDPAPQHVQAAIKTALLSIIMLDATLVFAKLGPEGTAHAIAVAALVIPALLLGRWVRMT